VLFHVLGAAEWEIVNARAMELNPSVAEGFAPLARRFDVDSTGEPPNSANPEGHSASSPCLHLCTAEQLAGVLERYFAGRTDLVVLSIDEARLDAPLRWEPGVDPRTGGSRPTPGAATTGHELFPHLYGSLALDAVVAASPLPGEGSY
jgi:uncharacterized protein (DUF952 family)